MHTALLGTNYAHGALSAQEALHQSCFARPPHAQVRKRSRRKDSDLETHGERGESNQNTCKGKNLLKSELSTLLTTPKGAENTINDTAAKFVQPKV